MSLLRTVTGAGCVGACMNKASLCKPFTTRSHSLCRLQPFNTKPATLHKVKLEFNWEISACFRVKLIASQEVRYRVTADGKAATSCFIHWQTQIAAGNTVRVWIFVSDHGSGSLGEITRRFVSPDFCVCSIFCSQVTQAILGQVRNMSF